MEMVKHAMAGAADSNQTHTPSSSSSGNDHNKLYKGVRKRKWGKWVSEIRLPNSRERIWLGSHDSPEKAARAFDAALYCLRGRHANFNFPDTPFNLNINIAAAAAAAGAAGGDKSLTPQEIQEVAAKFASEEVPPIDHNQEPQSTNYTTATSSSSSSTMCEYDGTVQVEHGGDMMNTMDWTFLNVLDDSIVGPDYVLYSELDKMHSGELLYSTPPPPPTPFVDNEGEIEDDDPFSHQSFLWNWNF